jgi:putative FmdB family regulatory protein
MPLYDYECRRCGPFREWRSMSDYEKPAKCPDCRKAARRSMATPVLGTMDGSIRKAHAHNEKSAHEPRVERRRTGGHDHAHDHGHSRFKKMDGPGHYARARSPWMVGH